MSKFEFLFKDLNVIELATALAGPLTATFLKELGANVVKIEPPQGMSAGHGETLSKAKQRIGAFIMIR
ncbi:MAG: CoA transferase [Saprospiraceae bacterium]|nr:CoA transferase [Saprospiraceae bacterium]